MPQRYHSLATIISILPRAIRAVPVLALAKPEVHDALTEDEFLFYASVSLFLVVSGGVFAGLTLGLMGQDEVYLKVIETSGSPAEQKNAKQVLKLINKGKHWVLVTLLLSNVITNETLPIVLDRCLGGGWPAVVSSTALIVVFGEIIPQSICVRYGLQIGAFFCPFVTFLMYLMFPIAYPIAVLLDKILGEDHGTIYKKSGLKTLVTLHRTMGVERLTRDEVTIISAVLDLKDKSVSTIMTPIENVYTMSADRVLDEETVNEIFNAGFSRIPVHFPGEPDNFIGMLLVRVLISYDPEDALPVASFPLATLPETSPGTSCLNILNYFQEGKSHMCVVSSNPGSASGAMGVLTLEDVIEELIGEEIVDESDVFVDIHQKIVRQQPGPLSKRHLTSYVHALNVQQQRDSFVSQRALTPVKTPEVAKVQAVLKPVNPASNPIMTDKPYVAIKRHSPSKIVYKYEGETEQEFSERVNKHVESTRSKGYGATDRFVMDRVPSPFLYNVRSKSSEEDQPDPELVSSSYLHNGIVESIVTVKGVSKTIIEPASGWDRASAEEVALLVTPEVEE